MLYCGGGGGGLGKSRPTTLNFNFSKFLKNKIFGVIFLRPIKKSMYKLKPFRDIQ